jgi:NAD(P)-dependent dehydrogenase (short-subunit alcohol dehydrogenase family)
MKAADAAVKHFDRIDLLVNNAGISIPKPFHRVHAGGFRQSRGCLAAVVMPVRTR